MRYLILSDIHANLTAFEAVLHHASQRRFDEVIFLGDIVGYYSEPEKSVALLRELNPQTVILGNHDAMLLSAVGKREGSGFRSRSVVAEVVNKHAKALSAESVAYIANFQNHTLAEGWEAAHGALTEPWAYLSGLPQAQKNQPLMQRDLLFFGHTHVPVAYVRVEVGGKEMWRSAPFRGERSVYRIPPNAQVLFNPGSVGQPRDGVSRASYAIFDEEARALEVFRVEFDINKVQRQLREAGYDAALGTRLEVGH